MIITFKLILFGNHGILGFLILESGLANGNSLVPQRIATQKATLAEEGQLFAYLDGLPDRTLFLLLPSLHTIFLLHSQVPYTLIIMDFIKKAVSSAGGNKEEKPADNNTQQNDDYVDKGE